MWDTNKNTGESNVAMIPHASGRFYHSPHASSTTTLALAANTLYAVPFRVPKTLTYSTINIEITTQAGQKIRLGIYTDLNGAPDARVLDAGELTLASSGSKSITINQSLNAGWYWLAIVSDGTPSVRAITTVLPWLGFTSGTDTTMKAGWSVAFTYGALPDPFQAGGALLATTAPRMMLSV